MAEAGEFTIGEWRFDAREDALVRPGERRKLEHRSARTLELLARRRGEIVPREAILEAVWNGRAVSPNSVAIVISDLRGALGDSARAPSHIETVAKRGYRLRADPPPSPATGGRRARGVFLAAAIALLLALGIAMVRWSAPPPPVRLAVSAVADQTGDPRRAPLADASSAVLLSAAQRLSGAEIVRAPAPGAVRLEARLILWSGRPTLMFAATDAGGRVIWSGYSSGDEDAIPADTAAAMRELAKVLARLPRAPR